jgi:undecaprenyl-phosphate 4-deoxy-4-formamido-L-arabinose transferase
MDKVKSVSIVIPVYNEEENLPELIERCIVACDKFELPYEVLLVDDGSVDKSVEIISKAADENDGRIIDKCTLLKIL